MNNTGQPTFEFDLPFARRVLRAIGPVRGAPLARVGLRLAGQGVETPLVVLVHDLVGSCQDGGRKFLRLLTEVDIENLKILITQ